MPDIDAIRAVVGAQCGAEPKEAVALVDALLARRSYDADLVATASALARDRARSWELRCLAILALEHQCYRAVANGTSLLEPLTAVGAVERREGSYRVSKDELAAGYSSIDPAVFAGEFARKLERAAHIHRRLRGSDTAIEDLETFLDRAGQECRLLLGRYLLSPADVMARVRTLLRTTTRGPETPDLFAEEEVEAVLAHLPAYEAEICRRLRDLKAVFWVGEQTPSRQFALVEYPRGTVVCVVKPPGSEAEIEIKRVGLRGKHPITIRWQRSGRALPVLHRLQGLSTAESLTSEATHGSLLARIYRLAQGKPAPISRALGVARIATVPCGTGEAPLGQYLGSEAAFGSGFADMRRDLNFCLDAFSHERETAPPAWDPDAETALFLDRVEPSQAILSNTTSLRLDVLSAGLAAGGPESYLRDLGRGCSAAEARRFADDLLEEVLDRYRPPDLAYEDCDAYVGAALARADNRRRANRSFLSLARQIGEFWGTLLAFRGGTHGESFVARNVGLRRIWRRGEWRVEIRFMDHDGLDLAAGERVEMRPRRTLRRMAEDAWYIFGSAEEGGELGHLARIYRVGEAVRERGCRRLRAAARSAYRVAVAAVLTRPELRELVHSALIETWLDLDEVVGLYRRAGGGRDARWRDPVERHLVARGRPFRIAADYVLGIEEQRRFLDKHGDIFLGTSEIADLVRGLAA